MSKQRDLGRVIQQIDPTLRAERHHVVAAQYCPDTLAGDVAEEFEGTYNPRAHEIIDAISAVLINSQAGLQLLSAESPDLEEVRQVLNSIGSAGKRAGEIAVRTRALMQKAAAADGAAEP